MIHRDDDENMRNDNLLRTSFWPAGFVGHLEDTTCETLDLVTEMTLADQRTKTGL